MDDTTFRILDTLSRELGRPLSIMELTKKIQEFHGTAYYANIYEKLRDLTAHGIITMTKAGKSSIVNLNFGNYFLRDLLTEMELTRKRRLLERHPELRMLCADIDRYCKDMAFIQSISLIYPEKNIKLNRAELLILLRRSSIDERRRLHELGETLQRAHNIKIDYFQLNTDELIKLLSSGEANPLKEMLSDEICVFSPQTFWTEILDAQQKGFQIRLEEKETDPRRIPEQDLSYNLARFGYKEFGTAVTQAREISKELLAASLLLKNNARRIEAIPVILTKGSTHWDLLIFLTQKYGIAGTLLGLTKALHHIKPSKETEEAIEIMQMTNVKEVRADENSIKERLRLYNVIR